MIRFNSTLILTAATITLFFSTQIQGKELGAHAAASNMETIQQKVSEFSEDAADNTGVLLLIRENGKNHSFAAGWDDRKTQTAIQADSLFEIGSMSKMFTAIAVQQLIEQKKLSLNTPVNTFYPSGKITQLANFQGKNYWDKITIGMLLKHTSGMIDYLNVYGNDAKTLKLLGGKDKTYSFNQIIQLALDHGDAHFKPGEKFKYCNTGYILLGDIITKVSGMDWRDYIQKNILDAVGMKRTYFGSRLPQKLRDGMPQGNFNKNPSWMPPTLASSAGEIVSNLEDLASFVEAWSQGKLYANPETLKHQQTAGFLQKSPLSSNLLYGYGIMKVDEFYGHGGQTFGFQSYMTINRKTGTIYIIGINDAVVSSMALLAQVSAFHIEPAK